MTTMKNTQRSSPYDVKLDQRVSKHECLRDRNNITTCRSPPRQCSADVKRTELQWKRQQEFLKRRQIEQTTVPPLTNEPAGKEAKVTMRTNVRKVNPLDRRSLVMAEDLGITWPDVTSAERAPWLKSVDSHSQENKATGQQVSNGSPDIFSFLRECYQDKIRSTKERGTQTQDGALIAKLQQRDVSSQTESGLITVKESDLLRLADYLQEALWREENLKQKLAFLQQSATALLLSSDKMWRTCCNEDLTRSRVEALESQLQVCTQKFKLDRVKKLMLQMEEQKQTYEEKALTALQNATEDKMEAEKKAQSLEGALQAALAESARWKDLYQELKENSEELRRAQEHTADKLHQLQSQLEGAQGQEAELKQHLCELQQEGAEFRSQITQLEDDNLAKQEQLQEMREKLWHFEDPSLSGNFFQKGRPAVDQPGGTGTEIEAQLRDAQQRLTTKEKECTDLRAELEAVEHECHTCLFRLTQCREEIRRLNARRNQGSCCSWLILCLFTVMVFASLALLLLDPALYGDQLQYVCRSLKYRVKSYLKEAASPKNSGCYRPI